MVLSLMTQLPTPTATNVDAVYSELAPQLMSFATGLVGRDDAPDVVSTAVLKALSSPGWPEVRNHRAYLHRAIFNEAQTLGRRNRQRRERELRIVGRDRWELPAFEPEVRRAVEELSMRQRAVIVLTYWADLDPPTIADHLGISEGAVRRHLARARGQLRKVLHA